MMNFASLAGSRHRWLRRGGAPPGTLEECLLEAVPAGETIRWSDAVERLVAMFFDRDGCEGCFGPAVFAFPDLVIAYRVQADVLLRRAVCRGVLLETEQPAASVTGPGCGARSRVKCAASGALEHFAAMLHHRAKRPSRRMEREIAEVLQRVGWPESN